jgi:hypothetical protein
LVPYYVQDMKDKAWVYVYDSNAPELSSAATANAEVQKNELSPISTSMRLEDWWDWNLLEVEILQEYQSYRP